MSISLRLLFWYDMIIVFHLSYSPDPHFVVTLIHPPVPSAAVFPCALSVPFRTPPHFLVSFLLFFFSLPDPLYLGVGV